MAPDSTNQPMRASLGANPPFSPRETFSLGFCMGRPPAQVVGLESPSSSPFIVDFNIAEKKNNMADLLNMNSNPRGPGRRKTSHKRRKVEDENKLTDDVFHSPSYDENSSTENNVDHPNIIETPPVTAPARYRYTIQDKLNAVKIFNAHKEDGISLKATSLELGVSAPLLSFWIENQQELERIENPSTSTRKPTAKYSREFKDHAIATYEAKKAKFSKKAISKELGISAPLLNTWIVKPPRPTGMTTVDPSPGVVEANAGGHDSVGDGVIIEAAAAASASLSISIPGEEDTDTVSDTTQVAKTEAEAVVEPQPPRKKQRKPTTSYSDEFKLNAVQEFWDRKTRCPQMSKASIAKDLGVSAPLLNTWIKNVDRSHFIEGTFGDTIGIV